MGLQIEDSRGSGRGVLVDAQNRLGVVGAVDFSGDDATRRGRGFLFNADIITMTTATESGVCYLNNTGLTNLILTSARFSTGASTGGAGVGILRIYRNPTAGTLISSGVANIPVNRLFSSSRTLSGTFLRGTGAALTVTGGTFSGGAHIPIGLLISQTPGYYILAPGNSIAVTYTPPPGNTSQGVMVGITMHEEEIS